MTHINVDVNSLIKSLREDREWISRTEFKRIALEKLVVSLNEDIRNNHEGHQLDANKIVSSLTTIDISVVGLQGLKEAIAGTYVLKWGDVWDTQEELIRLIRDYAIEITRAYDHLVDKEVEKIGAKAILFCQLLKVFIMCFGAMFFAFVIMMALSSMVFGLSLMPALMSGPIMIMYAPNTLISSPSGLFVILVSLVAGAATGIKQMKVYLKHVWTRQKGLTADDIERMKSNSAEKVNEVLRSINHILSKHRKIKLERARTN